MRHKKQILFHGFSLLEVVLAIAVFAIFASSAAGIIIQGLKLNMLSAEQTIANQYASEGLEAVKSIKNQSYSLLSDTGATGITDSGGTWSFNGTNNSFDNKYVRTISVSTIQRDASGNIVDSGGITDPNTKKITSQVTWTVGGGRSDSVILSTFLGNWNGEIPAAQRGGMMVYADGGSSVDTIKYRLLDSNTWNWSAPLSTADVDLTTTNKVMRVAKLYTSPSRIEKILISRHFDGSSQYIYAQIYNGTSWGNVILLSTWKTSGFLDVQNFDGVYLKNGDFMTAYSDNSDTPKFRTWNGNAWSDQGSLKEMSYAPTYLILKNRPNTNEAMVAVFDQGKNVVTEYFDGKGYSISNWNSPINHPSKANDNSQRLVDFDWNQNTPTKGGLIFVSKDNVKSLSLKIWTADQAGSGSWSQSIDTTPQFSNLGVLQIVGIPKADGFLACDKDNSGTPQVICYRSDFTPTWSYPANNVLSSDTDHIIEQSFDISVEQVAANLALGVFSDRTNTNFPAKFKTYNSSTNSWDASPITVNTSPYSTVDIKIVRIVPKASSDDMMILIGDSNLALYSFVWDGANNTIYTSPAGRAFTQQGINGSDPAGAWYDFAWD